MAAVAAAASAAAQGRGIAEYSGMRATGAARPDRTANGKGAVAFAPSRGKGKGNKRGALVVRAAGNTFGRLFRVTTFGESHCKAVGAIIDGCPGRMRLTEEDIQPQLTRRRPGQSSITTQRNETDQIQILSGTEQGKTLGTSIGMLVKNQDQRKFDYATTSVAPRPGHADYTYQVGAFTMNGPLTAEDRKSVV